ncbi:hypothetical protein BBJ28_00005271 [Nothophytophthora sp. Chile5]|nr:hypothetical protein BBJ28_00005271 [Nothophytophthora sp. Chile5]
MEAASAPSPASDGGAIDQKTKQALDILVQKKHCFKVPEKSVAPAATAVDKIARFRSLHAVRRWRGFARRQKEHAVLQQRAYFFLYYWLVKRSLHRLRQFTEIKRRERKLTLAIQQTTRQRVLVKSMRYWRLRLRLHQTLAIWRHFVRQRRYQALLYGPIVAAVKRNTNRWLLQLAFGVWTKQHTRKQAEGTLANVVDRQFYHKVCRRAWATWKSGVRQLVELESFQRNGQERRIRRVWDAWSARTREKALREQQRRRAVRSRYLRLLGYGFEGFRAWHTRRQIALSRAETMLDAADVRLVASAFSVWDHATSQKKRRRLKRQEAQGHSEARLLRRVWTSGFRCFFDQQAAKKRKLLAAHAHDSFRTLSSSFHVWHTEWQAERGREQELQAKLESYKTKHARVVRARTLESWAELTRSKAASRIVNAQIRGQAQRRLLQSCLAQWVTCVTVLRWQQIRRERARQHYTAVMQRKCLERWRQNVASRRLHRDQTRSALVHWKLTLQSKAFGGWVQYLRSKRAKQQRIHAALEFRHQQFVREGLRHWMTAAWHLQDQREQRVTRSQASHAAQIWRRVAAIARHWRYLAIRRRTAAQEEGRGAWQVQEDAGWLSERPPRERVGRLRPVVPLQDGGNGPNRRTPLRLDAAGAANWSDNASPLSGFVLLPRTRPQPRRPVEMLLLTQTEAAKLPPDEPHARNTQETARCGFQFPRDSFVPLTRCNDNRQAELAEKKLSNYPSCRPLASDQAELPLPNATTKQLDVLERQLLALSDRKKEWRTFQHELESLRSQVDTNPQLLTKLRTMEKQHETRSRQWLQLKERIRMLATEIQLLRSALYSEAA